jgi:hypothetical protein
MIIDSHLETQLRPKMLDNLWKKNFSIGSIWCVLFDAACVDAQSGGLPALAATSAVG